MSATAPSLAPAPGGTPKPSGWSLRLRVASGVAFVPILVLLAWVGGVPFVLFVALQIVMGLVEFYRMVRAKGHEPDALLGHLAALMLLVFSYRPATPHAAFLATASLLLLLAWGLRRADKGGVLESLSTTAFGVLYVGWLSSHFVLLRELPWRVGLAYADGAKLVLFAFFVTWSCDTGAYTVGRLFGRRRLWEKVSPKKTVEGAIGGFVFAVVGAWIGRAWFMHSPGGEPWLRPWDALAVGVLVGVCGQVGDLVESLLKRDAASGDSSDLIPGHGGILDRFDSLYFGAPIVYYYLRVAVFQVP